MTRDEHLQALLLEEKIAYYNERKLKLSEKSMKIFYGDWTPPEPNHAHIHSRDRLVEVSLDRL